MYPHIPRLKVHVLPPGLVALLKNTVVFLCSIAVFILNIYNLNILFTGRVYVLALAFVYNTYLYFYRSYATLIIYN